MRSLAIWTLRSLRTSVGLYLGLTLLVTLVVVIGPGARRAARILHGTVDGWAQRLGLADVEILHSPTIAGSVEEVRRTPGVRGAEQRLRGPGHVELAPGRRVAAWFEVLPEEGEARLNRLEILEGRRPTPDEAAVLVDRSVAAYHGVRVGTRLTLLLQDERLELPVVGIVLAAEYPFTPVHPEHALPGRGALAPLWISAPSVAHLESLKIRRTCLLLAVEPGADPRQVARAAAAQLNASVSAVVPREEAPAQRFADMVLSVFDAYLPTVDATLTLLAAVLLGLVLGRRVRGLRGEVALWLALGQRPLAVACALVLPGLLATSAGIALGVVGHRTFAFAIHDAIEASMGIAPAIDPGLGPEVLRIALVLLATAALAGGLAAFTMLRRRPARLLREGARPGGGLARRAAASARRLPTPVLLGLSQALSRPWAALGLLLALAGTFAALLSFNAVHRSYEIGSVEAVQRSGLDAVVRLDGPQDASVLDEVARRAQGRAEPLLTGVGLLAHGPASRFVQVVGLVADGWGADLRCWKGRRLAPGADDEVLVDRWVAEQLGLGEGARVDLFPSESVPEGLTLTVVGVVETLSVGRAYVSLATAQALYGLAGMVNGAQVASALPRLELEAALAPAPHVERALSLGSAREDVLATLEGGRVVLRMALVFSALLTATFLAVLGAMDARDRLGDVAVLHALGWSDRALALVVGVETALRASLALALGLLGAIPLTAMLLARLGDADRHTLDPHPSYAAPLWLAGLVLLVVPLAAAPALRTLLRLSPARALRLLSRE